MNTPASIVKRFYECLLTGDLMGISALLSENVILHVPGRHQLAGDYQGPQGIARFAASSRAVATEGEETAVVDILEGATFVAALCRVQARRPGQAPLDNRTLHLARVESGRIAEIWFHNFDQHAVDVGVIVVHGAYHPPTRRLALTVASLSKVAFIALVLSNGWRFLEHGAGTAVAVDSVMVILFVSYLIATRKQAVS